MWFYSPTIKVRPINNVSHGKSNTGIDGTFMAGYQVGTLKDARDGGLRRLNQKYISKMDISVLPWWRHEIETFSALLAICAGNSPVSGEFPTQRPETRSFDVFFDLRLNKRFSKQWWGWWFETLSRPLWRHCNGRSGWHWLINIHLSCNTCVYLMPRSLANSWTITCIMGMDK